MNDLEIFSRMNAIQETHPLSLLTGESNQRSQQIAEHRVWLRSIRHERPNTGTRYKIGVYIRYFNQTKYEDYLAYHKKQFFDSISLCPNWELIDFYVDEGSTAPNMESAPAWSRLLCDCMDGKVDLIITQKVSNVSKSPYEICFIKMHSTITCPVTAMRMITKRQTRCLITERNRNRTIDGLV